MSVAQKPSVIFSTGLEQGSQHDEADGPLLTYHQGREL